MREIKFEDYQDLVYSQAWKYFKLYANNNLVEVGDLISEGYLIFVKAVEDFDPNRGVQFSTFLTCRLKRLIDLLRKEINFSTKHDELVDEIVGEEKESDKVESILEIVSDEGRKLIEGVVAGIFDVINPIRQTVPGKYRIMDVCREIFGWNRSKTERVFTEVQVSWARI